MNIVNDGGDFPLVFICHCT